jgi:hypothetical protein
VAVVTVYRPGMSLPPDQPPPSAPAKLSTADRRARHADRLTTIRLRMAIGQELDARDITTPADIGAALGMPASEAFSLRRGPGCQSFPPDGRHQGSPGQHAFSCFPRVRRSLPQSQPAAGFRRSA